MTECWITEGLLYLRFFIWIWICNLCWGGTKPPNLALAKVTINGINTNGSTEDDCELRLLVVRETECSLAWITTHKNDCEIGLCSCTVCDESIFFWKKMKKKHMKCDCEQNKNAYERMSFMDNSVNIYSVYWFLSSCGISFLRKTTSWYKKYWEGLSLSNM